MADFIVQRKGSVSIDTNVLAFRILDKTQGISVDEAKMLARVIVNACPANGIYGKIGTVFFVAGNGYDNFAKVIQGVRFCDSAKMKKSKRRARKEFVWQDTNELYPEIMSLAKQNNIVMRNYRALRPQKSDERLKEWADLSAMQRNSNTAIRKTKCKGQGSTPLDSRIIMAPEHKHLSCLLYGNRIDMNNNTVFMSEKVSQYMDGTGICSAGDNSDRRPQMPVFPERSYKAK